MENKITDSLEPSGPQDDRQVRVVEYLNTLHVTTDTLKQLMKLLSKNFDSGLTTGNPYGGTIKMLPTYVRAVPDGSEEGDYIALDLGGTNFRILLVQIVNHQITTTHQSYRISKALMEGDGDMFDYMAEKLAEFAKQKNITELPVIGFTFSFPVDQKSLYSGYLIKWTKGYTAPNVEGNDVVVLLKEAIVRRKEVDVGQVVLINDTTGVMLRGAFDDSKVAIGLILGTGTNACYMEKLDKVQKWDGVDDGHPKQVIINTEWGAFGDKGDLRILQTESDLLIDRKSVNPGGQQFEKLISGMYLGCIVQMSMVDLIRQSLLLDGHVTPQLEKHNNFDTQYVSEILSGSDNVRCGEILSSYGYTSVTSRDCEIVKDICDYVSRRAARLAGGGVAAIVERINENHVTVAVDGSLFQKHPTFKQHMEETLRELIPQFDVKLKLAEDGSGVGAALAAAVAKRLVEQKQR